MDSPHHPLPRTLPDLGEGTATRLPATWRATAWTTLATYSWPSRSAARELVGWYADFSIPRNERPVDKLATPVDPEPAERIEYGAPPVHRPRSPHGSTEPVARRVAPLVRPEGCRDVIREVARQIAPRFETVPSRSRSTRLGNHPPAFDTSSWTEGRGRTLAPRGHGSTSSAWPSPNSRSPTTARSPAPLPPRPKPSRQTSLPAYCAPRSKHTGTWTSWPPSWSARRTVPRDPRTPTVAGRLTRNRSCGTATRRASSLAPPAWPDAEVSLLPVPPPPKEPAESC